jgi:hypothetical protein
MGGSINAKLIERQFGHVIRLIVSISEGTMQRDSSRPRRLCYRQPRSYRNTYPAVQALSLCTLLS